MLIVSMWAGSVMTARPQSPQGPAADPRPANAPAQKPVFPEQTDAPDQKLNVAFDVVTAAEGLEWPWSVAFLPDGRMLITERGGRLRVMGADGKLSPTLTGLPVVDSRIQGGGLLSSLGDALEIDTRNQAGLLDLALDPKFETNGLLYWCYSEQRTGGNNTAVARGRFVDGPSRVENVQVIFHQTPSLNSTLHFGCRLVWNRDGTLFVTLGERSIIPGRMQAQRLDGLLGKIVRINADGTIPRDNPFVGKAGVRPEIWSIGHRNVQAAALHPTTGELWEVEHGARGGDELNIARKGKDYGWPTISYGIEYSGAPITGGITQKAGMEQPVYYWDPVIAPCGMVFYTGDLFPAWKGSVFIGGLVSQNLVRLTIKGEKVVGEERLLKELRERIRDVKQGPDGALYLLTDSRRGRLLKLVPKKQNS